MKPKKLKTYLRFNMSGTYIKKLKRLVVLLFIIQGSCTFFLGLHGSITLELRKSIAKLKGGGGIWKISINRYFYLLIILRVMTNYFMERSTNSPLDL